MKITDETFHARIQGVQQFLEEEDLGALFAYSPAMEHMWGQTGQIAYLSLRQPLLETIYHRYLSHLPV